jgi:hypothetical protein
MWKCVILLFLSVTNFATKTCSNQGAYNFTIFLAPTKILIVSGQCNTVTKDFTIFSNLQSAAPGHWLSAYSTFPPGPAKFNLGLGHCSLLLNRVPLRRCFPKELTERCLNCLSFKHRVASCWQPSRCLRCHSFRHRAKDCTRPRRLVWMAVLPLLGLGTAMLALHP